VLVVCRLLVVVCCCLLLWEVLSVFWSSRGVLLLLLFLLLGALGVFFLCFCYYFEKNMRVLLWGVLRGRVLVFFLLLWEVLGASWSSRGSWGVLGGVLGGSFGSSWGVFWVVLGGLWAILGNLWCHLGRPWGLLGVFGISLDPLGRHDQKLSKKHPIMSPILDDFGEVFGAFLDTCLHDVRGLRFCVFLLVGWVFSFLICVVFGYLPYLGMSNFT
jgi:hypothetical protein